MSDQIAAAAADITADLPAEPYPGLRPFNPDEWAIFFGREPMIDEVIRLLASQHLVVVHGASGWGKSSLVRAGVLPWLALDHAASGVPWRTAITRPAGGPLGNFAAELARTLGPPPSTMGNAAEAWHDRLALGRVALPDIQTTLDTTGASLCLLVDQFEELFRWAQGDREEAQLITELLQLIAEGAVPRLFVILTMRSDYLGACAGYGGFAETVNRCQYLLPRMDDFALLRAIHDPALRYCGMVAAEVGDRLLFEARREQDSLPVLQHTLMRACRHARERHGSGDGWLVTSADVAAVEGPDGALATHAEEVLAAVTKDRPERMKAAEWVFRTISDLDVEGRLVRRPRKLGELVKVARDRGPVQVVVEAFLAPRCSFLTSQPPGPLSDASEIDISHEALIRRWPRLASDRRDPDTQEPIGWAWREFEDGLRWRALAVQAAAYEENRKATLSPATTESYLAWWPMHGSAWAARYAREQKQSQPEYLKIVTLWHASQEALVMDRARVAEERLLAEKERHLRLRAQRFAHVAGALTAICFMTLLAVGWFWWSATIARNDAIILRNRAVAAEERALSDTNRARDAENQAQYQTDRALTAQNQVLDAQNQVLDAKHRAVVAAKRAQEVSSRALSVKNQALERESRLLARIALAAIDKEGPITAGLVALRGLPIRFDPPDRPIVPDTAAALESALLTQAERRVLQHSDAVLSAAFSPDDVHVLTASLDQTARLWDAATGQELQVLRGHEGALRSAVFSPDGTRVLTASDDQTARLWDIATGQELQVLRGHKGALRSAVFSPDGARVLTASDDRTARLWDTASGRELVALRGHEGGVNSAVFSSDGARVLTASSDKTARLWETWPTVKALVEEARRRMPRQLTPDEERHFGLRSTSGSN